MPLRPVFAKFAPLLPVARGPAAKAGTAAGSADGARDGISPAPTGQVTPPSAGLGGEGWSLDEELERLHVRRAAPPSLGPLPSRPSFELRKSSGSPCSTTPSSPGTCGSDVISLFSDQSTETFPFAARLALGDAAAPLRLPAAWPGDLPAGVARAVTLLVQNKCNTAQTRSLLADDPTGEVRDAVSYVLGQVLLARAARSAAAPAARRQARQRRGLLAGWLQRLLAAGADHAVSCARHGGQPLPPAQLARRLRDQEALKMLDQAARQAAKQAAAAR